MRMKKNQSSKLRYRSVSHSDFIPFGLDLSNFLDDFQKLEILLFAMKGF